MPENISDKEKDKFIDVDGTPAVRVSLVSGFDAGTLPDHISDREKQKFVDVDGNPAVRVAIVSGTTGGDVAGPSSSTDNAVARFDSTTGKIIQNSAVTIDDSGNIATSGTVDGRDISADGSALDALPAYINAHLAGQTLETTGLAKNDVPMWNGTQFVMVPTSTTFVFSIASFTSTGGSSTVEIGTGNWKAIGAISFSATYNNGPATGGFVSHSGWSSLTLGGTGFVGPTVSVAVVTYPASPGLTKTFTLNATDGSVSPTSTLTFTFNNQRFWGVSTVASGYTEANVEGLASNELSNSRSKTFSVTPGATEYIIYAYRTALGTATFTVGGFAGGFQSPETVSVTNASGYTENYYVYRSTLTNLGATIVVVS